METIKNFVELVRGYALAMTFASAMVIWAFAHFHNNYSPINFILLFIALCMVHMFGNLFDDYADIKKKLKEGFKLEEMNFDSHTIKARLIRNSTFSLNSVEIILTVLALISTLVGAYFTALAGFSILFFMLLGGILILFYPISSKYGVSEIIIGLLFGPIEIMGGYLALTGEFDGNLFLLSIAIFFSTLVLLHTDNIMDWEFDIKNGKKTLAILSQTKQNAIKILELIIYSAYTIVVFGVIFQKLNPFSLYVFLTLPIAVKLIPSITEYVEVRDVKFEPRWYWGLFENWKEIEKQNASYYMFRFYLARNFAFWFAFFVALGTISGPNSGIFGL